MRETGSKLKDEESKAREEATRLEKLNDKMKSKLSSYQELYDYHQKMIQLGTKLDEFSEQYFVDNNKRQLVSKLLRLVETENSKRKKDKPTERKEKQQKKKEVTQEVFKEIVEIRNRKKKKAAKEKKEALKPKPRPVLKLGDRVRLIDGKAVGSIDSIKKNKAIVNYGMFTTHVDLISLELVERKK
jgi:DNA mismatch repair protein MutS2